MLKFVLNWELYFGVRSTKIGTEFFLKLTQGLPKYLAAKLVYLLVSCSLGGHVIINFTAFFMHNFFHAKTYCREKKFCVITMYYGNIGSPAFKGIIFCFKGLCFVCKPNNLSKVWGHHGLVVITLVWRPGGPWFKYHCWGKIFIFQILLLEINFKSLCTFGKNV